MKLISFTCCLSLLCVIAGCDESQTALGDPPDENSQSSGTTDNGTATANAENTESNPDVELMGRKVDLAPENTSIEFVGVHSNPDKPDPRKGSFQKLSGTAMVDETLMSVQVDIDTTSLTTEIEKLTNHLKSPDFFDVNQYPTARFESTKIVGADDGTVQITGDLTLLGKTESVTFPATIGTDADFTLEASLEIDRTRWGMDFGTDNVKKEVALTIKIGKK